MGLLGSIRESSECRVAPACGAAPDWQVAEANAQRSKTYIAVIFKSHLAGSLLS